MARVHVMTDPDELAEFAEAMAHKAKRAALLAAAAVIVACVVLALDYGIKKAILDATDEARRTVDKLNTLARIQNAITEGAVQDETTGEARATPSTGDGADSSVADDSGPRTPAPANEADRGRTTGRGKTGVRPGP